MEAEGRAHPQTVSENERGEKAMCFIGKGPISSSGEVLGGGVGQLPLTVYHAPDGKV